MEYEIREDTPVSIAVVRAVSTSERRTLRSLPPLYTAVDPDALDSLFVSTHDDPTDNAICVSFPFSDSLVTIDDTERVLVETAGRDGQ